MQAPPAPEMQNLIKRVSPETVTRPPGFVASIILDILTLGSALAAGWLYHSFLAGLGHVIALGVAAGVFALSSVFQSLLARSRTRRLSILLLELAALVGFFYDLSMTYVAIVGAGGFFFFLWGEIATSREIENSLEIKFFSAIKPQLNRIITGLSLLAVLLYLPQWNAEQSFLSRKSFDVVYVWVTDFVDNFYVELKFDGTVGDFATSFAKFQYAGNTTFNQLLPPAQEKILNEARTQILSDLQAKAKIQIAEEDKANLVAYRYMIQQFNNWKTSFGNRFLLAWGLLAFMALRGFGFIFYMVIGFVAYFLYQMFLSLNIIKVVGESRMKESIEYS